MSTDPKPSLADVESLPVTISVSEACRLLGVGRGTGYQLARDGRLPGAIRLGSRIVVSTAVLLRTLGIESPGLNGRGSP
jgi:excisionase family DNA binding protein